MILSCAIVFVLLGDCSMNKGSRVLVFKGRANKGVCGIIFWMQTREYGYHKSGVNPLRVVTRVGIRQDNDEVVWDYLSNCRAVENAI